VCQKSTKEGGCRGSIQLLKKGEEKKPERTTTSGAVGRKRKGGNSGKKAQSEVKFLYYEVGLQSKEWKKDSHEEKRERLNRACC